MRVSYGTARSSHNHLPRARAVMLRRSGAALPLLLCLAGSPPPSPAHAGRTAAGVQHPRADSALGVRVDSVFAAFAVPGDPGTAAGVVREEIGRASCRER